MNPMPSEVAAAQQQPTRAAPSRSRRAYLILASIFFLGVAAQAFFAGAGIFVGGSWMLWHIALGHLLTSPLPLIPLAMVILSFTGRLPRADKRLCGLLFLLAMIQPVFLYLRGVAPILAALHPLNALLLFTLPLYLVMRARQLLRQTAA
jgi:hypothetical protein